VGWIGRATPSGTEKVSLEGGLGEEVVRVDALVDEDA
jgi:hypothetical protein